MMTDYKYTGLRKQYTAFSIYDATKVLGEKAGQDYKYNISGTLYTGTAGTYDKIPVLPGNILYLLKISIARNESSRGQFTGGAEKPHESGYPVSRPRFNLCNIIF
jgi:hypothetical protein